PTATGTDNVAIRLSGTGIGGSPYTSVVGTGGPSATQTTASVPAGTAGALTAVTITVRDASGNIRTTSNDAALLAVTISGANAATPTVTSAGSGTYTASYTPTATGTDNVAIRLSGTGIGGSPRTEEGGVGEEGATQGAASGAERNDGGADAGKTHWR